MGNCVLIKRLIVIILMAVPLCANTCTPLTQAATPPNWPAIVNGVVQGDEIGDTTVRLLWTSDNSPNAAVEQQIRYCHSGAGCTAAINCTSVGACYNLYFGGAAATGQIQGGVLPN